MSVTATLLLHCEHLVGQFLHLLDRDFIFYLLFKRDIIHQLLQLRHVDFVFIEFNVFVSAILLFFLDLPWSCREHVARHLSSRLELQNSVRCSMIPLILSSCLVIHHVVELLLFVHVISPRCCIAHSQRLSIRGATKAASPTSGESELLQVCRQIF